MSESVPESSQQRHEPEPQRYANWHVVDGWHIIEAGGDKMIKSDTAMKVVQ